MKTLHRDRVSASRVAALWDEHRMLSRRHLWEYCANGLSVDKTSDSTRARTGRVLEAGVLAMAAEDLQAEVVHLPQDVYLPHPRLPTGCTADGYVNHPSRGPGIVSVKTCAVERYNSAWFPMKEGVPRETEMQLQTELATWRALAAMPTPDTIDSKHPEAIGHVQVGELTLEPPRWGCIAVLVDNEVKLFGREVDTRFEQALGAELSTFFRSIHDDRPPAINRTLESLPLALELWPVRESSQFLDLADGDEGCDVAVENIELLHSANQRKKDAEADIGEAKSTLLELAGGEAGLIRAPGWQCRINTSQVRPSTKPCPNCGHDVETRRGGSMTRFTPREQ